MINVKNKKGSIQDLITLGLIIFFFAVVVIIGFKVMTKINTHLQTSDITNNVNVRVASTTLLSTYPGVIDNSALFLAIGLSVATLALAALVRVHPIFIPFFFIGLLIVIFISAIFSNIYQEMAANPNFSVEANQLTFTTNLLTYLPFIIGIVGLILMVVMYKSWETNQ